MQRISAPPKAGFKFYKWPAPDGFDSHVFAGNFVLWDYVTGKYGFERVHHTFR